MHNITEKKISFPTGTHNTKKEKCSHKLMGKMYEAKREDQLEKNIFLSLIYSNEARN